MLLPALPGYRTRLNFLPKVKNEFVKIWKAAAAYGRGCFL